MFRIGIGYDVHRLVEGRKLIIGGVEIPYDRGLQGHSDADVLTHAICDALLGAAALGDIGQHFSDRDPQWAGIDSFHMLKHVVHLVTQRQMHLVNVDSNVVAQAPKLAPYIPAIRQRLADALNLPLDAVSVKAKTNEGLDSIGRSEGIAAQAAVLLKTQE